jgi:parvulin-like peptidyl-prolyl isomerase
MLEVRHARHSDHEDRVAAVKTALGGGKDFAKLVEEVSDGPNRSGGGDLGWQDIATMRPEFRDALGTFQKDSVTAPIPLGGSTYFFKLLDSEAGDSADFESMRPTLARQLRIQQRDRRYKQWVETLRRKAYVRVFFK